MSKLKQYLPLIVLVGLSFLAALAIHTRPVEPGLMPTFMGLFLVIFSMFKFFDLAGFAKGFAKYDLLAMRAKPYGFIYPFFEAGLGLAYLNVFQPKWTNIFVLVLMSFGTLGVVNALRKGLDLRCACLGTTLNVPLSTVAIVENVTMSVMAACMLAGLM